MHRHNTARRGATLHRTSPHLTASNRPPPPGQAELEKGIKEGLARVAELEQRAAAVASASADGGDADGEDPVRVSLF